MKTFIHQHPYPPFILDNSEKLIVGTLPPPRFSTAELEEKDVDFCYGSYHNSLWKYIDHIHNLDLKYDNTKLAVDQRKEFLIKHKIGVCDIVERCERHKIDASDLGMKNVKLRDLISYLVKFPSVHTLLFIGGNSKNGPEYFFRKQLKEQGLKLNEISSKMPRTNEFELDGRKIRTVSLISSSGAANLSIGSQQSYKKMKRKNPNFTTFDFRIMQYKEFL